MVVADKDEPDYKHIEVSLEGLAFVILIEMRRNAASDRRHQIETRTSSETYTCGENVVVWSKADTPGNKLIAGSHTFPFL